MMKMAKKAFRYPLMFLLDDGDEGLSTEKMTNFIIKA